MKYLEKYVEWIALGFAALWVLWVVWAYGVNRPVFIKVGNDVLSPGEVDVKVRETADRVKMKLDAREPLPSDVKHPDLIGDFEKRMKPNFSGDYGTAVVYSPPPQQIEFAPDNAQVIPGGAVAVGKAVKLPIVPRPMIVDVLAERDQVIPQNANLAMPVAPAAPAGAAGIGFAPAATVGGIASPPPPVFGGPPPGMAAAAPARAPAAAGVPQAEPIDLNWVQVTAKFPEREWHDACVAAGIANILISPKTYLQVQLVRQEQLADGTWGAEMEVPPLKMNTPPIRRTSDPSRYATWAASNQPVVLTPPFYPRPNGPKAGPGPGLAPRAPDRIQSLALEAHSKRMTAALMNKLFKDNGLTAEEINAVKAAKQKLDQEDKAPKPPQPKKGGKKGGGGIVPGDYDAQDPQTLRMMLAQARPGAGSLVPGAYTSQENAAPPPPAPGAFPAMAPAPMSDAPAAVVRPNQNLDFDLWAYDDTVQPGKVYRYKMRVLIKNPLYSVRNAGADEAMIKILDLPNDATSSWSEWTNPVEVKSAVQMYLVTPGREQVRFNVFRWQNGRTNKCSQPFSVSTGDAVGGIDKDGIDYRTGWTVADIRLLGSNNDDCRVTLIDENGSQRVRTYKRDRSDRSQNELDADASRGSAMGAGGMGGMPGMGGMGGMPGMPPPPGGKPGGKGGRGN